MSLLPGIFYFRKFNCYPCNLFSSASGECVGNSVVDPDSLNPDPDTDPEIQIHGFDQQKLGKIKAEKLFFFFF